MLRATGFPSAEEGIVPLRTVRTLFYIKERGCDSDDSLPFPDFLGTGFFRPFLFINLADKRTRTASSLVSPVLSEPLRITVLSKTLVIFLVRFELLHILCKTQFSMNKCVLPEVVGNTENPRTPLVLSGKVFSTSRFPSLAAPSSTSYNRHHSRTIFPL